MVFTRPHKPLLQVTGDLTGAPMVVVGALAVGQLAMVVKFKYIKIKEYPR